MNTHMAKRTASAPEYKTVDRWPVTGQFYVVEDPAGLEPDADNQYAVGALVEVGEFINEEGKPACVCLESPDYNTFKLYGYYSSVDGSDITKLGKDASWYSESALNLLARDRARHKQFEAEVNRVVAIADQAYAKWVQHVRRENEKAAYAEFLREHGDPELWEDEKKHRTFACGDSTALETACRYLAERHVRLVGLTVGEILDKATAGGAELVPETEFCHWYGSRTIPPEKREDISKLDQYRSFKIELKDGETDAFDAPRVEVVDDE